MMGQIMVWNLIISLPTICTSAGQVPYRGEVVDERVHPYVYDMAVVKGNGHAPLERGTGDAEILAAGQEEVVQHLIRPGYGLYEIGVLPYMLNKARSVLRNAEEIRLLLRELCLPSAVGADAAGFLQLGLRPERLALGAVMPLVLGAVDIALIVELLEYLLNALHVVLVGSPYKAVVGNIHELPQLFKAGGDPVGIFLRSAAGLCGIALYLLTVLIRSREEKDVMPRHSLEPREGVRIDRAVGMPDVRIGARVVDGSGDVIFLVHSSSFCL